MIAVGTATMTCQVTITAAPGTMIRQATITVVITGTVGAGAANEFL